MRRQRPTFVIEIKQGDRWLPYSTLYGPGMPDIHFALHCVLAPQSLLLPPAIDGQRDRDRIRLRRLPCRHAAETVARYFCKASDLA